MGRNLWVMKHEIDNIVVSKNWMREIIVHVFSLTDTEIYASHMSFWNSFPGD